MILGGAVDRGPAQLREDELHLPGQGLHRRCSIAVEGGDAAVMGHVL